MPDRGYWRYASSGTIGYLFIYNRLTVGYGTLISITSPTGAVSGSNLPVFRKLGSFPWVDPRFFYDDNLGMLLFPYNSPLPNSNPQQRSFYRLTSTTATLNRMEDLSYVPSTPITNTPNWTTANSQKLNKGDTPPSDWALKVNKVGATYGTGDTYLCSDGVYRVDDNSELTSLSLVGTDDNYIEKGIILSSGEQLDLNGITIPANKSLWISSSASSVNVSISGYKE